MSASRVMPRPVGIRSADMRRTEMPPATAATHATNCPPTTPPDAKGQSHGSGGRGVSPGVPGVWWRHPTQRKRPAGAGSLRTGGSHVEEGQDGFARVKSVPDTPRRTARAASNRAGPWPAHRRGESVQAHDDRAIFQATDRRAARDRHPQPLAGVRREASKPRERPTGPRSARDARKTPATRMRGVSRNPFPTPGPLLPRLTSRSSAGRPVRRCH